MVVQGSFAHILHENIVELKDITTENYREYITPDGNFPSVTTVLNRKKKEFFVKWNAENPGEGARCLKRGIKLHGLFEDYLKNSPIDLSKTNVLYKNMFMNLVPYLNKINNIRGIEIPLWSKKLGLAGRSDCIAEFNGKLSIIDFKGSTKEKKKSYVTDYFLQCACYAIAYEERYGVPVRDFAVLITCEDGIVHEFTGKVLDYIPKLKEVMDEYWESLNV